MSEKAVAIMARCDNKLFPHGKLVTGTCARVCRADKSCSVEDQQALADAGHLCSLNNSASTQPCSKLDKLYREHLHIDMLQTSSPWSVEQKRSETKSPPKDRRFGHTGMNIRCDRLDHLDPLSGDHISLEVSVSTAAKSVSCCCIENTQAKSRLSMASVKR